MKKIMHTFGDKNPNDNDNGAPVDNAHGNNYNKADRARKVAVEKIITARGFFVEQKQVWIDKYCLHLL